MSGESDICVFCVLCLTPPNLCLVSAKGSPTGSGPPTGNQKTCPLWSRASSQGKCRRGKEENILFSFFMTHIKFPHVSTNLVRTIKLPDCDSGLNNTFNQHRECTSWFSLWETVLRDSTTQDKSRKKHGKGWTNFSKQMGTDNQAQF